MPRRIGLLLITAVTGFALLFTALGGITAHAETFNQNDVMDDVVFSNYNSMSADQIDGFLNGFANSCISTNSGFSAIDPTGYNPTQGYLYGGNVSAGRVIYDAAQAYGLNPQVLLATLQKEQSLVSGDAGCTTNRIAKSLGYGCPDGGSSYSYNGVNLYTRNGTTYTSVSGVCVNSAAKAGFSQQIIHAAWMFKYSQQRSMGNIGWAVIKGSWDNSDDLNATYSGYMTQGCFKRSKYESSCTYYDGWTTIDSTATHMDSGATAALYRYTPHFSGNRNFDTIFNNWFGSVHANYAALDNPRWMVIASDTTKVNPATGLAVDGTITAGTQLQFVDKLLVDGTWYLRTAYDSANHFNKGILLSKVTEISFQPLSEPRYMMLSQAAKKVDPRNGKPVSSAFTSGTYTKFVDKMQVNGLWYYRTQFDSGNNSFIAFPATVVSDITYVPLDTPRYMQVQKNAQLTNLRSDTTVSSYSDTSQVQFADKVLLNGAWYYRTLSDSTASNPYAVAASSVSDLPYTDVAVPYSIIVTGDSTKYSMLDGTASSSDSLTANQIVKIAKMVSLNGVLYYQTAYDAQGDIPKGIPVSVTKPNNLPFIPLDSPRNISLSVATQKTDLYTGNPTGEVLAQGRTLFFSTKVQVAGVWYLRTQYDSANSLPNGIPITNLNM